MKNENKTKVLTHEELELVTGGAGGENPVPDDLSDRQQPGEKEKNHELPAGPIIT